MKLNRFIRTWSALLCVGVCVITSCARDTSAPHVLRVAAAADLKFALDDIIERFHEDQPQWRVRVVYGSSGKFFAQLANRAPFDIYFSADMRYPEMLVEQGLADPDTLFHYAVGRLVIWTLLDAPLDVTELEIEALRHPAATRISLANPRHAPYGVAAEAALRSYGVFDEVRDRLVFGENVAQAAQFVESGTAPIGVIALSLAWAPVLREKGVYWEIPLDRFPRLNQGGVILPWAENPDAARAFRAYVLGGEGRAILKQYGFYMPEE